MVYKRITVYNKQKAIALSLPAVTKLAKALLAFLKIPNYEMILHFVAPATIKKIHKNFFNDPLITDCITFPYSPPFLGEIFICPKAAILYCKKYGGNVKKEVTLYLVHGILHLIGYDDIQASQRRKMRRMEEKCMKYLYEHSLLLA